MKKLFNAIRKSNINEVKSIISDKPELVNCVAKQPPKKDDGQSSLQVALKTGNFEIAEYLMEGEFLTGIHRRTGGFLFFLFCDIAVNGAIGKFYFWQI